MSVCNHDCIRCPFEDCINNDITWDELQASRVRDRAIVAKADAEFLASLANLNRPMTSAERQRKHYILHGEEVREKARLYHQKNIEKRREYFRKYYAAHREANRARRSQNRRDMDPVDKNALLEHERQIRKSRTELNRPKQAAIRHYRQSLGLSQTEFGAPLGVMGYTVSKWESGHSTAPWERLYEVYPDLQMLSRKER